MGNFPMNIIGTLVGFGIGLWTGGILGAVFGAFIGRWVDNWRNDNHHAKTVQMQFTDSLFACMGMVSKADGRVSEAEIAIVEQLFDRMAFNELERKRAIAKFREGKSTDFSLHRELAHFKRLTMLRSDLRRMFLEILIESIFADGRMTEPERLIVVQIAAELHIGHRLLERLIRTYHPDSSDAYTESPAPAKNDPFAILGVSRNASAQVIKRSYRKLMSQYHPDKLVAKGLPENMLETARRKASEINAAYDKIKEIKGFR